MDIGNALDMIEVVFTALAMSVPERVTKVVAARAFELHPVMVLVKNVGIYTLVASETILPTFVTDCKFGVVEKGPGGPAIPLTPCMP
jgi:hypothetical protein